MPISIPASAHIMALLGYGIFAVSLSVIGTRTWLKAFLTLAAGLTALWAGSVVAVEFSLAPEWISNVIATLRDGGWYAVVLAVLYSQDKSRALCRSLLLVTLFIVGLHTLFAATGASAGYFLGIELDASATGIAEVIIGLILIENMMRNLSPDQFWSVKHLGIGLVAILVYQLLIRVPQFLTDIPPRSLIEARPLLFLLVLPLFAVTATRSPGLNVRFHSSRKIVFHTATLIAVGLVLQGAAIASFYLHTIGGDNGTVLSIVFGFVSTVGLVVTLSSGTARSRLRAFVNENFFKYKYDYRLEWNKFIRALSAWEDGDMPLRVLRTLAELLDSPGGMLWVLRDRWHQFMPVAYWSAPQEFDPLALDDPCVTVFSDEDIAYLELKKGGDIGGAATWRDRFPESWLAVPLRYRGALIGIALLNNPRVAKKLDWEDKNLISLVSLQLAAYLFQEETAQALADARQLEEFNKRFAFILHDTKNAIGQLSLLVRNVEQFGHMEEFRKDMTATLRHSVEKLEGLLAQLRGSPAQKPENSAKQEPVDVTALVSSFVREKRRNGLDLEMVDSDAPMIVNMSDKKAFEGVLDLVVSNALEAAPKGSTVNVRIARSDRTVQVTVSDKGPGMTQEFIAGQLFRPLRTTKGGGFGIGAYQAREIMRDLGGNIDIRSKLGEGTMVTLSLPNAATEREMARA